MLIVNLSGFEFILIVIFIMTLITIYVLLYKSNNKEEKKDNSKCINCTSLNCVFKNIKIEEINRNCEEEGHEK